MTLTSGRQLIDAPLASVDPVVWEAMIAERDRQTWKIELIASVGHSLALVLDDGPVRGGVASTVVAVSREGALDVLREGALDAPAIYATARGA